MEKFITYPAKGRTITVLATGHNKCNTSLTLTVNLNKRQTGTYRIQFNAAPFDHWAQGLEFRSEHECTTLHFCIVLCCVVFCSVVFCCVLLCFVVLCCVVLCCVVLCCVVLCCLRTQCFSTFMRPRPGKFFFQKTRARSQQIYS